MNYIKNLIKNRMVSKVCPDKTGTFDSPLREYAGNKFKIINQAYEILSDDKKLGYSNVELIKMIRLNYI